MYEYSMVALVDYLNLNHLKNVKITYFNKKKKKNHEKQNLPKRSNKS